jgi:hypothetical protein
VSLFAGTLAVAVACIFATARGVLDKFVELAAVKPYATAFWAVVNFDS